MLKHVSNFFLQIFPSVIATVVGAYIVTNYINAKPADAPKAAVASTAEPAKDVTDAKDGPVAKAETPAEDADKPKSIEKAEKPTPEAKRPAASKAADKSEKPVKAAPAPVVMSGPAAPAPVTVAVAPSAPMATDPAPASENRDANELARAALDRLRGPVEAAKDVQKESPKQPEPQRQAAPATPAPAARAPEPPKVAAAPTQPHVQQSVQPLPPAMLVTAPNNGAGPRSDEANAKPRETVREERSFSSFRPPADIPLAPPLDLQAASRQSTSITDDVVSTARSVINAVIPR
ncbi:MAG: hypothetical protein A4S14_19760 [Proteobacteria bacterium SG_bin9]|nr:MAG: hypothetical protein A4S14_19760 [Proteobacteria bacterium SG_bin9]